MCPGWLEMEGAMNGMFCWWWCIIWDCRWLRECRPQRNKAIAVPKATAAAPIAIPAMAPGERGEGELEGAEEEVAAGALEWVAVGVGVEVEAEVVKGLSSSSGQASPGRSMKLEFLASSFCVTRDVLALGLMTPTIW